MHEIETKILEVDGTDIRNKMLELGAGLLQDTRLTVDWYGTSAGINEQPWYLRVRTTREGKTEITWKSSPVMVGNTRQSKEINVKVSDFEKTKAFFEAVGLVHYAHQEKDRTSWQYQQWQFDLDQYPGMPAYLEIEGSSVGHIAEAIKLLNLQNYESVSEGERKLIENRYHLNWTHMQFNS